jgi:hypothetical protein
MWKKQRHAGERLNCPKCKTPIADKRILSEAAKIRGSKGGKTTGKTKARDSKKMRAAALKRWSTQNLSKQIEGVKK